MGQRLRSYLWMGLTIVLLLSLPVAVSTRLRSSLVSVFAPLWKRSSILAPRDLAQEEAYAALALENAQLKSQVQRLIELLEFEERAVELQQVAVPARIIYRLPNTWNSTCWLDVGEADNEARGRIIIAINSPVVVGNSLIGIIDEVKRHQCRMRLITDPGFTPSVRAARGEPQRQQLLEHLDALASGLAQDGALLPAGKHREILLETLLDVREALVAQRPTWLLAKGELHGSSSPLWRRQGNTLRGIGFNYDFADEFGPARDLSSGRVVGTGQDQPSISILKVDDLLVTTGLDGILPAGLHVAEVTAVHPLGEGDYFYELEARPTAGDLDSLSLVSILPPL
jgi:rod shape-determining protein MreC